MAEKTRKELEAELAEMQAKLEMAQANINSGLTMRVSPKGGVSVYGLNSRFPVTLYRNQWFKLLSFGDQIKAFMEANAGALASKG
jgi:ABC-type enterochelin transport system substrate-binding protein